MLDGGIASHRVPVEFCNRRHRHATRMQWVPLQVAVKSEMSESLRRQEVTSISLAVVVVDPA